MVQWPCKKRVGVNTIFSAWLVSILAGAGVREALHQMWKKEGFQAFFKGLQAKLLQAALNAALMLMLKEKVRRLSCMPI
jgi:hypothetical protein